MSKKIVSDMIFTKRSIRQIPISPEKKERLEKEIEEVEVHQSQRRPMNPKFLLWTIATVCLLALFFGLSIFFTSATVIITPKVEMITFNNDSYLARQNATGTTDLSFEVMSVEQTAGEEVLAGEEKEVSQKASGKIVIYNNYSTASQRLINNTRFEANNGKIYRINSSVVVPGLKKVDGKVVPGSIEAVVYADQAGESYNLKLSDLQGDFKIPGFKGDPRYNSFYARLKTDLTGGLIGKQRVVSAELRKEAEETLKVRLKEQLLKELYAIKPENFLMFKDGYSLDYINLSDTPALNSEDKVQINMKGVLNGIVFNGARLAKYFAVKKVKDFDGLPVEFIPTDDLAIVFVAKDNTGLWKNNTLEIKLTGEAVIKWLYDTEAIKKDLAGQKGTEVKNLAVKYQNSVKGLQVIFKPVWARYFPDDFNKIKVKEAE